MPPRDSGSSLPLFLSHTQRERDEFSRALGMSDYDDINLFNLLCFYAAKRRTAKVRAPDLLTAVATWARKHGKHNLMGGAAKASLRRLLSVLERNGYATTSDDWDTILLRDGDRRAGKGEKAVARIEKAYRAMEADPLQPYPTSADTDAPPTAIVPASCTEFSAQLVATHASSTKILKLTFSEDLDILVTPSVLPKLLDTARKRVHFYVQNNPNLYNYVLHELKKIPQFRNVMDQHRLYAYLENRQETPPLFWVYLGLAVARSRNEDLLEPKLRRGRVALFQSAYLLHSYWQHEHQAEQEHKRREQDQEAVVAWVQKNGRGFSVEELADIRDEAGKTFKEKYPDIRGFFEELIERLRAQSDAAGKVPPIVQFGDLWMHRDVVAPLLVEELKATSELCRKTIEADWKTKLDKGSIDDPAMHGDGAFDTALRALMEARSPRLAGMLKKPRLVHLIIAEAAEHDAGAFRTHAALFESLDDPTWKGESRLLGLERARILADIVSGLSLLRRILIRRRLRPKKPEARPTTAPRHPSQNPQGDAFNPAWRPDGEPKSTSPRDGDRPAGVHTVKVTRHKRSKPKTVAVGRPSRRNKGPKTVDEAMSKLKEAMSRRRR